MHDIGNNSIRNRFFIVSIVWLCVGAHEARAQSADSGANLLSADTEVATAGYFQLRWESAEPIRLIESTSEDFGAARVVYEGSDSGHAVSGRPDGELFYRLESAASGEVLSEPLRIVVAHHPLGRALAFFGIGAIVFLATLVLILTGSGMAGGGARDTAAGSRH